MFVRAVVVSSLGEAPIENCHNQKDLVLRIAALKVALLLFAVAHSRWAASLLRTNRRPILSESSCANA